MIGDQNKINKIYGAVAFKKEQNFFKDILGIKSIDHFKTFVTITITIAILIGVLWSLIYFYDIKAYLNLSGESIIWILLASISIGIFVLFVFFFIVFFPYLYSNCFNIYQNNKFFSVLILLLLLIPWLFVFIILSITTKSVMISGLCTLLLLLIIALISIYFKYDIKRILPEYLVFVFLQFTLVLLIFYIFPYGFKKLDDIFTFYVVLASICILLNLFFITMRKRNPRKQVSLFLIALIVFLNILFIILPANFPSYVLNKKILYAPYFVTRIGGHYKAELYVNEHAFKIYQNVVNSTDLNDYSPCKNKRSKIHIIRVTVLFSLGEEYIVLAKKDIQEDKKNKDFDLHKNHILKLKKDDTYAIYYISEHKKKKVSDKSKRK